MIYNNLSKHVEFLSDLILLVLTDESFRLEEPFYVICNTDMVIVPAGFQTDLASVPRLPVIYLAVGGRGHKAAVLHDYLYKTGIYDREVCDGLFYEALVESGVNKFYARMMHSGVRVGGGKIYEFYAKQRQEVTTKSSATLVNLIKEDIPIPVVDETNVIVEERNL